jgi:general secretion pathway protein K
MHIRRNAPVQPKRQRGVVLVMVLWVILLLMVLVTSFVQSSTSEGLQARFLLNSTQARYAAEAGLHRAVVELRNPTVELRWYADGRPYEIDFDGATVTVQIIDDSGKIDIAQNNPTLFAAMFQSVGVAKPEADRLAGAMADWLDPDDLLSVNGAEKGEYEQAGLAYVPANRAFQTVSELQQVLGMSYELYLKVEDMITINSGSAPNGAFAQADVLRALLLQQTGTLPSEEEVNAFVELRRNTPRGGTLTLPTGQQLFQQSGSQRYTVWSEALLPSGARASLKASIQVGQGSVAQRPFRIERWRDN